LRGRRILSVLVVFVLLVGTIHFIMPQVQAYARNIGIAYVGASHELPIRDELENATIIVSAYNEGYTLPDTGTTENFDVNVYYYNNTKPKTLIGTLNFLLTTYPPLVLRNETAKALIWNITSINEGTYKFYANITNVPIADEYAADNTRSSEVNANPRQQQLGIIRTHNVGINTVTGSFPNIIKAGTTYSITVTAFNNGYSAETFTVTTYYNRSEAPGTFVPINVTTITNLPAKTGTKSWSVLWDTTGRLEDEYSISSNASVVTGEKITYEQYDFANDLVTIIQHDIAVLDVIAYPTGATAGSTVKVNMTVENQGAVTETFTVRVKANTTEVATPQTVSNLASGANKTVTFNWNTLGWSNGFYILNGSADFVAGEKYERADNVYRSNDIRRRVNIPAIHNIATTFVSTNATYAKPGDQVRIFAVVENRGDADESFTATPYYDSTQAASTQNVAIIKRVHTGEDYGSENLDFTWDTTGVPLGTYYIKVAASVVAGETYTTDNNLTDGRVVFTKVYINPSRKNSVVSGMYNQKPTANTPTGTLKGLANPANAYDNNNATYATLKINTTSGNYVDFHTFTTPGLTTNVAQVDVKILWGAAAVPVDVYRITQGVGPSVTNATLKDWNSVGALVASTVGYDNRPEPNDGVWSWTDVQNIHVRFETDNQIKDNQTVRAYEIWVNVYNTIGYKFYCKPTAHVASGITSLTNPTNAYDESPIVDGNATYAQFTTGGDGYFSLKTFNITAGTGTISRVDLRVRYYISTSTADRFNIQDLVSPSTSKRDLVTVGSTNSEVNFTKQTYVYSYKPEPNNGNWSWTDVQNIRVRFVPWSTGQAENRTIRIYEIWATVYDKPFTVTFNVGGVSSLGAWSARIQWDPTVLDLVNASKKGFFGYWTTAIPPVWVPYPTSFSAPINHTGGYVDMSEIILGPGSTSGSGALAKLDFKVIKAGKSLITPADTLLVNAYGQNMEHYPESGKFNTLPLTADLDGDGDVDAVDIGIFNNAYGSKPGDPNWNANCDFNLDNIVDAKDLRYLGKNYW